MDKLLSIIYHLFINSSIYWGGRAEERKRENLKYSLEKILTLSLEPDVGLGLTTLSS